MSAIWGAVSLNNKTLPGDFSAVFSNAYRECSIDREEVLKDRNVVMGCEIQYFTKEAEGEQLPFHQKGVWFTADVVLDNREELLHKLEISTTEGAHLPDGELLLRMYQQFGRSCMNDLLGAYAFVYYDEESGKLEATIDAVGNRTVYYTIQDGIFYFSTLLEPLAEIVKPQLNDRWITDFLAMDHLVMSNEPEETPYAGIFRIAPAYHLTVTDGKISKHKYWDPAATLREMKHKSDEEYKDIFRRTFFEAVKCTLRSDEERPLSAMLSGGSDSTSVVSIATKYLKENEKIFSFTSIPLKDYQVQEDGFYIEDETELVKRCTEYLGNIEPYFVTLQGVDAWNGHEKCLKEVEMPYKSSQNLLWMTECMRLARTKGSRIMLTGSYGNTTISFTGMERYMNYLISHMKWLTFERELTTFRKIYGFDQRKVRKSILKAWLKRPRIIYRDEKDAKKLFKGSYARREQLVQQHSAVRVNRMSRRYAKATFSRKIQKELINQDIALRQIGETEMKFSLFTGVLLRDPTRDKRIIELCIRLPLSQYTKNGEERRLVSVYLKDIVPPAILEKKYQGRQSADFKYRLSLRWENIREEWMERYKAASDSRFVDTQAAYENLLKNTDISAYNQYDLTRHVYTQLILEFEKNNNNVRKRDREVE